MVNYCRSCFQPLKIYNQGFLSIFPSNHDKLTKTLTKLYFKQVNINHFIHAFESKSALKEFLSFIHYELGNTLEEFKGVIHKEEVPGLFERYSLQTIYEHTFHENTVNIIKNGEFISYLQPIINMDSGDIYGYESLLRVKDQSIFPSQLFEVARKTEMHSILDKKAREIAIESRTNRIPQGIKSFINFLPSTIYNPAHCLKHTFQIVEKYNVDPYDLVFEVVETEKIHDVQHLKSILETYREHGMKVALDDVGAGYSTLDMLSKLRPDYIKIDRKYIQDCHMNKDNQTFLLGVMNLAKDLGITVLGEGIETKEEFQYLKEIGIDLAQGYFIGKPSPNPSLLLFDKENRQLAGL